MLSARVERKKLIKKYPQKLAEVNRKFLPDAANILERNVVDRVKVDTGRLKGSITQRVTDDQAIVGTNVEYAPYVEYGTYKMDAQEFLRPAIDELKKPLIALYKRIFRSVYGR